MAGTLPVDIAYLSPKFFESGLLYNTAQFNAMPPLSRTQLKSVASGLTHILDNLQIGYAIMGGAAACLLTNYPAQSTEDVDLVIHVDQRMIKRGRRVENSLFCEFI